MSKLAPSSESWARTGLLGHGHREFRTFGDAVGPALHDALVARVKAHGFLAVRVMIAELPAKLEALIHSELDQLEIEFGQMTDAFADCFRKGDCRRGFPTVRGALAVCAEEQNRFAEIIPDFCQAAVVSKPEELSPQRSLRAWPPKVLCT